MEPSGPVQKGLLYFYLAISFRCIRFEYSFSIDPYVNVFTNRTVKWLYLNSL